MKIYEAMRLGSMALAPEIGTDAKTIGGVLVSGCARGTAMFGAGIMDGFGSYGCVTRAALGMRNGEPAKVTLLPDSLFPPGWIQTLRTFVVCPTGFGCEFRQIVWEMIEHLNDAHRWAREEIATWLEGVEDPLSANYEEKNPEVPTVVEIGFGAEPVAMRFEADGVPSREQAERLARLLVDSARAARQ